MSEVVPVVEKTGMYITDIEILRLHYAETLKAWSQRFAANRDKIAKLYDERFCRMWEFYLAASEATFRYGGHIVFQMQMTKDIEAVPTTRGYITEWEHGSGTQPAAASAAE
jgi:cyclopropane-fatty-acyl-phospholipid synthase